MSRPQLRRVRVAVPGMAEVWGVGAWPADAPDVHKLQVVLKVQVLLKE